jgi:hypothetical protein
MQLLVMEFKIKMFLIGFMQVCIVQTCINPMWNTCVTWQGIDYKLPWGWHDSVETSRIVLNCEIIVHLLVIV